jgi:small-conductance mechanosensitive channel
MTGFFLQFCPAPARFRRTGGWPLGLALCISLVSWSGLAAQSPQPAPAAVAPPAGSQTAPGAVRTTQASTLIFFNRPIVVLRAQVLGRSPAERTTGATRMLDDLVNQGITGPVEWRPVAGGALISVGTRGVFGLTSDDVDDLSGETVEGVATESATHLRQALGEAAEARAPGILLRSAALASLGLIGAILALWGLTRAHRVIARKFVDLAERKVTKAGLAHLHTLRASRVLDVQRYLVTLAILAADLVVIFIAVTFMLRRFPYTRPWGESMRGFLLATFEHLGLGILSALPGLFTVFLIVVVVRFVNRLIRVWFDSVEAGQVTGPPWLHPDTAQQTRRLVTLLLYLLAIVVAYPYMPGSETEAFKGVSVFLGLMVTFGSSGLVNQIMSGFMITYSRSVKIGDVVRIGDVEGTVTHIGVLSTKLRTFRKEEITIPNAVVVTQTTTDYSRFAETEGVLTPTSVTIGYDAPWRQVHALLLSAAERTPGLRKEPKPYVLQVSLDDFYVKYTLLVSLERQNTRPFVLNALHANIQDLFNEYGVQIMSPNYEADPGAPKVVAKKDWYAAPARPDAPAK